MRRLEPDRGGGRRGGRQGRNKGGVGWGQGGRAGVSLTPSAAAFFASTRRDRIGYGSVSDKQARLWTIAGGHARIPETLACPAHGRHAWTESHVCRITCRTLGRMVAEATGGSGDNPGGCVNISGCMCGRSLARSPPRNPTKRRHQSTSHPSIVCSVPFPPCAVLPTLPSARAHGIRRHRHDPGHAPHAPHASHHHHEPQACAFTRGQRERPRIHAVPRLARPRARAPRPMQPWQSPPSPSLARVCLAPHVYQQEVGVPQQLQDRRPAPGPACLRRRASSLLPRRRA